MARHDREQLASDGSAWPIALEGIKPQGGADVYAEARRRIESVVLSYLDERDIGRYEWRRSIAEPGTMEEGVLDAGRSTASGDRATSGCRVLRPKRVNTGAGLGSRWRWEHGPHRGARSARPPNPLRVLARHGKRLLHKPIRNPVHQLVGGITHAGDTHLREKLGERVQYRQLLMTFTHRH